MQDDSKYPATADVMRMVKPTYVGKHIRSDSADPDERIFRRMVQRDTMRALTVDGKFSVFGEPTRHAKPCVLHPHDNPPCFVEHHLDEL